MRENGSFPLSTPALESSKSHKPAIFPADKLRLTPRFPNLSGQLGLTLLALSWPHRLWRQITKPEIPQSPKIPLMAVGGLTLGGAGKTPLVMALVRLMEAKGHHPILLMPWLNRPRFWQTPSTPAGIEILAPGIARIHPEADWRYSSDEAVMAARQLKCPVILAEDRRLAWRFLSQPNFTLRGMNKYQPNCILADDGLRDGGLHGADFICVMKPPVAHRANAKFNHGNPWLNFILQGIGPIQLAFGPLSGDEHLTKELAFRRLIRVPSEILNRNVILVAGIGNFSRFSRDALAAGLQIVQEIPYPDHGIWPQKKVLAALSKFPNAVLAGTAKDAAKFPRPGIEGLPGSGENPPLWVLEEQIEILNSALLGDWPGPFS